MDMTVSKPAIPFVMILVPFLMLRNSKSALTTLFVVFATESDLFSLSVSLDAAYLLSKGLPHL
jgi:hypothetical protein